MADLRRVAFVSLPVVLGLLACSSDEQGEAKPDPNALAPGAVTYPQPGSLSAESGKNTFRFGAASAATQIEDNNPNTDWYVFTQPKDQGGLGQWHLRRQRVDGLHQGARRHRAHEGAAPRQLPISASSGHASSRNGTRSMKTRSNTTATSSTR